MIRPASAATPQAKRVAASFFLVWLALPAAAAAQRLSLVEAPLQPLLTADLQDVDSYVLAAWVDDGSRGAIPGHALVLLQGSAPRERFELPLPPVPPELAAVTRVGLATTRGERKAIEHYSLDEVPRLSPPDPVAFSREIHAALFASEPGDYPLYEVGGPVAQGGVYAAHTLQGEAFSFRLDEVLITPQELQAAEAEPATGPPVDPAVRELARQRGFAGLVGRATMISNAEEREVVATVLTWNSAASGQPEQWVSVFGVTGSPLFEPGRDELPAPELPPVANDIWEWVVREVTCEQGRLVVDPVCRDAALRAYRLAVEAAERDWSTAMQRLHEAYEAARRARDVARTTYRLYRARVLAGQLLVCAPAAVALPLFAACVGRVLAATAISGLSFVITTEIAFDEARRLYQRRRQQLHEQLRHALGAAGRALVDRLRQCLSCEDTPEFVFVASNSFRETAWGGWSNPTSLQQEQRETTAGAPSAMWASELLATPQAYSGSVQGSYSGFVSCAGPAVEVTQRLDYTYSYSGGVYIPGLDGSATVDVYVRAAPGTFYGALVERDREATGRAGELSAGASVSAFGSSASGRQSVVLRVGSSAVSFGGSTYHHLGRVAVATSLGGGVSCIMFCPSYSRVGLRAAGHVRLSFTPLALGSGSPP